jgi:MYXO-CTERM domain-containing protein
VVAIGADAAAVMNRDAATTTPEKPVLNTGGGGCSFAASSSANGILPALALGLLLALRRRRR